MEKQVNHYLSTLERCKVYEIRFDNNFSQSILMAKKRPANGKIFEYFDSTHEFISVEGKYSYMFPRKSMNEKEYSFLKNILKEKIKID